MFKINTPYRKDSRVALIVRNSKKKNPFIKNYKVRVYHIQGTSGTPQHESTYCFYYLYSARRFMSLIATKKIYNSTGFFTRYLNERISND